MQTEIVIDNHVMIIQNTFFYNNQRCFIRCIFLWM